MIKKNSIKWHIFEYNLIVNVLLIIMVSIIFNVAVRIYVENDIISQLNKITSRTVDTALRQAPPNNGPNKPVFPSAANKTGHNNEEYYRYYFMLNRSLKEPLSLLNADYILLDNEKKVVAPFSDIYPEDSSESVNQLVSEIIKSSNDLTNQEYLTIKISGTDYIAVVKPLSLNNNLDIGWIIIYSSLQKVNQLQFIVNILLFIILIVSSIIALLITSNLSSKLTRPLNSLNQHIKTIAGREFGNQIKMPVYDELSDVVDSINVMSEKLGTYDKAQKTFLQNVSHEFRTPLMSIQSYAEGIKYDVVDNITAADIILGESKRMSHMLEELLYLSRLETIEESYKFVQVDLCILINCAIDRLTPIALKNDIKVITANPNNRIEITADEEKLSQAITNIISNCIRYAQTTVTIETAINDDHRIQLSIYDDGPGFNPEDLPNIFERFYKGNKGNFGLGLAISKNVIEKHRGAILAKNRDYGGASFIIELPI